MTLNSPRRSAPSGKAGVIALVAILALGLAGGIYWWYSNRKADSKTLVRGLPKDITSGGGINFRVILEHEKVKPLLEAPMGKIFLDIAKAKSGVEVPALESAAVGMKLEGNEIHFLAIMKGRFEVETVRGLYKLVGAEEVDIKGNKFGKKKMDSIPFISQRKMRSKFDEVPEPSAEPAGEDGTDAEGKPSLAEQPPEPVMPTIAEVVFGPIDDRTLIAGSQKLVEAYLAGGDTVADDAILGPLVKDVADDAALWGVGKVAGDGQGNVVGDLLKGVAGESLAALDGSFKDSAGLFEVRLTDKVEIRCVMNLASAEVATEIKGLMDTLLVVGQEWLKESGSTANIAQDDKRITITGSTPLPDLSKFSK